MGIVDLRDEDISRHDQIRREALQSGAQTSALGLRAGQQMGELALGIANHQQRERFASGQVEARKMQADTRRRDSLISNQRRALDSLEGLTREEGDTFRFDQETFQRMHQELSGSRAGELSTLLAPFDGLQNVGLDTPEGAQMFAAVAGLYETHQTERSQEVRQGAFNRISKLAEDERSGIDEAGLAAIGETLSDPSMGPKAAEAFLAETLDTAAGAIGFAAKKETIQAEADELWAKVRPESNDVGEFGGLPGAPVNRRPADLMKLYGRVAAADNDEDLMRARDNFLIKGYGLDGIISDSEDKAFEAGRQEAARAFKDGRAQVFGEGEDMQIREGPAMPFTADLPPEMQDAPLSEQIVYGDAVADGIDLANEAQRTEWLKNKRIDNPYYGMTGSQAGEKALTDSGMEQFVPLYKRLLDSGVSAPDAARRVMEENKAQVLMPRQMTAALIGDKLKGMIEAWNGKPMDDEAIQSAVSKSGIFNFLADSAEGLGSAAKKVTDAEGWMQNRIDAVQKSMDSVDRVGRYFAGKAGIGGGANTAPASVQPFGDLQMEWDALSTEEQAKRTGEFHKRGKERQKKYDSLERRQARIQARNAELDSAAGRSPKQKGQNPRSARRGDN